MPEIGIGDQAIDLPCEALCRVGQQDIALMGHVKAFGADGSGLDGSSLVDGNVAGLTLSFPEFNDAKVGAKVEYKGNLVEWRSIWDYEAGDDSSEVDGA